MRITRYKTFKELTECPAQSEVFYLAVATACINRIRSRTTIGTCAAENEPFKQAHFTQREEMGC